MARKARSSAANGSMFTRTGRRRLATSARGYEPRSISAVRSGIVDVAAVGRRKTLKREFGDETAYQPPNYDDQSHDSKLYGFFVPVAKWQRGRKAQAADRHIRLHMAHAFLQAVSAKALDDYLADRGSYWAARELGMTIPQAEPQELETYLGKFKVDLESAIFAPYSASIKEGKEVFLRMPIWTDAVTKAAIQSALHPLGLGKNRSHSDRFIPRTRSVVEAIRERVDQASLQYTAARRLDENAPMPRDMAKWIGLLEKFNVPTQHRRYNEIRYRLIGHGILYGGTDPENWKGSIRRIVDVPYQFEPGHLTVMNEWVERLSTEQFKRLIIKAKRINAREDSENGYIQAMLEAVESFRFFLNYTSVTTGFNRVKVPETESGIMDFDSISARDGDFDVSVNCAVRLPETMVRYLSQEDEPVLDAIAKWGDSTLSYLIGNRKAKDVPKPYPDPLKVIEKIEEVVKPVKVTGEDDLAVDSRNGTLRYLPTVELDAFTQSLQNEQDESYVEIEGESIYNPSLVNSLRTLDSQGANHAARYEDLPQDAVERVQGEEGMEEHEVNLKERYLDSLYDANEGLGVSQDFDMEPRPHANRNRITYTNWHLGVVTHTNQSNRISNTDVTAWRPARVRDYYDVLNGGYDMGRFGFWTTMEALCRELGLSTQIRAYAEPDDFKIVSASWEEDDLMNIAGSFSLSDALDFNVRVIERVQGILASVNVIDFMAGRDERFEQGKTRAILNDMVRTKRSDGVSPSDPKEAANNFFHWEYAYDVRQTGSGESLPSPYRFIKRVIDAIWDKTKGDYVFFMGEKCPGDWWDSACEHLAIVTALHGYDDLDEFRSAVAQEEAPMASPELDPDYTPEPVPNIAPGAEFSPWQVRVDNHIKNGAPRMAMLVAPGGGKTILATIAKGARSLGKGWKVLIISPDDLIYNYHDDVALMTGGRINVVTLKLDVYKPRGSDSEDPDAFYDLIDKQPPNTLFVLGMNAINMGLSTEIIYNGREIHRRDIVEIIRLFPWDEVIIDESHRYKDQSTKLAPATHSLLRGIPNVTIMTGTIYKDNPLDIWGQSKYLHPGIFANQASFESWYKESVSTGKKRITMWKPNAAALALDRMSGQVDVVSVRRVEWAAWLPPRKDEYKVAPEMTDAQRALYDYRFQQLYNMIEVEEKKGSGKGKKKSTESGALEDDDLDDSDDTTESENAERSLLQVAIAKVETAISSPDAVAGPNSTTLEEIPPELRLRDPEDLLSPKAKLLNEILDQHFADEQVNFGKVMVLTQWVKTRESLFENLAPQHKQRAMEFTPKDAKRQTILVEGTKNKERIIIARMDALKEGFNLQMFTRMIFVEPPWTPGAVEQVEARMYRPDPSGRVAADLPPRTVIYFTTLIQDHTMDLAKSAKLASKRLITARGNSKDNPELLRIPDSLPPVPMSSKLLNDVTTWDSVVPIPGLKRILDGAATTAQYYTVADFMSYVGIAAPGSTPRANSLIAIEEREMDTIRARGQPDMVPIPDAGLIPGSEMAVDVPYVTNMRLPHSKELGLHNLFKWARDQFDKPFQDIDPDEVVGKMIHTQFGDGVADSVTSAGKVKVVLTDGEAMTLDASRVFLVEDPDVLEGKSVKSKLAELSGMPLARGGDRRLRVSAAPLLEGGYQPEEEDYEDEVEGTYHLDLTVVAVDSMLAVRMDPKNEVEGTTVEDLAEAAAADNDPNFKFTPVGGYMFILCNREDTFTPLYKNLVKLHNEGTLPLTRGTRNSLRTLKEAFSQNDFARQYTRQWKLASRQAMANFRRDHMTDANGEETSIYPMVSVEGTRPSIGLICNLNFQTKAARILPRQQPVGPFNRRWRKRSQGFLLRFATSVNGAKSWIDGLQNDYDDGVEVDNYEEVLESLGTVERLVRGTTQGRGRGGRSRR